MDDSREFIDSPVTWKSAANENEGVCPSDMTDAHPGGNTGIRMGKDL